MKWKVKGVLYVSMSNWKNKTRWVLKARAVYTYRFMLIEAEDEDGFYGHATQRQTNQQEQQPLCYPAMPLWPQMIQPWWQRRLGGMGVHHIYSGIVTIFHAYRTLRV